TANCKDGLRGGASPLPGAACPPPSANPCPPRVPLLGGRAMKTGGALRGGTGCDVEAGGPRGPPLKARPGGSAGLVDYQDDLVTPVTSPWRARSRRQIRHMLNLRRNARGLTTQGAAVVSAHLELRLALGLRDLRELGHWVFS